MLDNFNKLFDFKSFLPLQLKLTFPPLIWIFTEGECDEIKSRLTLRLFSTLPGPLLPLSCNSRILWSISMYLHWGRICGIFIMPINVTVSVNNMMIKNFLLYQTHFYLSLVNSRILWSICIWGRKCGIFIMPINMTVSL